MMRTDASAEELIAGDMDAWLSAWRIGEHDRLPELEARLMRQLTPRVPVLADFNTQEPSWPETMDEARRWIDTLRGAYQREATYVKRLEGELNRQREVVDIAEFWFKARGMHIRPWLDRLKGAVRMMLEEPRHA
jgi:hypothetical protein